MFADTEVTSIVVAAITAVALVLAAWIPTRAVNRARTELHEGQLDVKARLGVPNGDGDIATMQESALESHRVIRTNLDSIAAQQEAHSLLDTQRFRALFDHAGLPYPEETP